MLLFMVWFEINLNYIFWIKKKIGSWKRKKKIIIRIFLEEIGEKLEVYWKMIKELGCVKLNWYYVLLLFMINWNLIYFI